MTDFQIQPTRGEVIELILDDHRRFEELLRLCRRNDTDRAAARNALAESLVAHARAEEEIVYPEFRSARAISGHDEEHGQEEHGDIIEALLGFLDAKGTDTQKYDDHLEALATAVNHHSNEEELSILNPGRDDVSAARRETLGAAWVKRRNDLLRQGCASRTQVAALLKEAVTEGVLAPEPARDQAEQVKAEAKAEAKKIEEAAKVKAGRRSRSET